MPAAAAFECGEIIGAPFYFQLIQFGITNSLFLYYANDFVEGSKSIFAGNFRLVKNACGHLRRAVVAENIVYTAVGFHGDLFFENQFAMHATGAAAVQSLVEKSHGAPIGCAAR